MYCQKQYFASCTSSNKDVVYPLKFCKALFSVSPGTAVIPRRNGKKGYATFGVGGETRCDIGDAQMENRLWCVVLIITVASAFGVFVLNKVAFESECGLCYFVTDWVIPTHFCPHVKKLWKIYTYD